MTRLLSLLLALAVPGSALAAGSTTTTRTVVFQAPFSGAGTIPTDLACKPWLFGVGLVDGADAWQGVKPDGTAVAGITQGASATYQPSPFGSRRAVVVPAGTTGPYLQGADADALAALLANDHAILAIASPKVDASAFVSFESTAGAGGPLLYLNSSASNAVAARWGSVTTVSTATTGYGRWVIVAARKLGTTYAARVAGTNASTGGNATATTMTPGSKIAFGYWQHGTQYAIGGPMALVAIYPCTFPDGDFKAFEASWTGARASDGRPVTVTRSSSAFTRDTEGQWVPVGDGIVRVENPSPGPPATKQLLSYPADLSNAAWTKTGTVAVTRVADAGGTGGYVNRISGGGGAVFQGVGGLTSSARYISFRLRLVSGSGTVHFGYGGGATDITTPSSTFTRYGMAVPAQTTAQFEIWPNFGGGTAVYEVDWTQLDDGPAFTEFLNCTTGPCTRGTPNEADVQARNLWKWSDNVCKAGEQSIDGGCVYANGYATLNDTASSTIGRVGSPQANPLPVGHYTLSCEMAKGTTDKAALWTYVEGAATGAVCGAPLTDDFRTYSCPGTIVTGATTAVVPLVSIGQMDPTATGTIKVRRCQFEPGDVFSGAWILTAAAPAERRSGGGARLEHGITNYALYSNDASQWSSDDTLPTRTLDFAAGPLSRYNGGNEADKIADTSTTAWQNAWRMDSHATRWDGQKFTGSIFAWSSSHAAGSRFDVHDGTTAGPSAAFVGGTVPLRYSSTMTAGVDVSYVAARLSPTVNTVANTGSVVASGIQLELGAYATSPFPCGASACTRMADLVTVGSGGWPVASGRVCVTFSPSWTTAPTAAVLLDARTNIPGDGWSFYIAANGALVFEERSQAAGGVNSISTAQTWPVGSEACAIFDATGATFTRNGVAIGNTSKAGVAILAISPTIRVGSDFTGYSSIDGQIQRIVCGRL